MIAHAWLATNFGDTVRQILKRHAYPPGQAPLITTYNLGTRNPRTATKLMSRFTATGANAKSPVLHMTLSFRPTENPTDNDLIKIVEAFMSHLHLTPYQTLLIRHGIPNDRHVHIVTNRAHPATGRLWHVPLRYWKQVHEAALNTAAEFDLIQVSSTLARAPNQPWHDRSTSLPRSAHFFEKRHEAAAPRHNANTGKCTQSQKSLITQARIDTFLFWQEANCWQQLHEALATAGYSLIRTPRGLAISDGTQAAAAGRITRHSTLPQLEARFGPYSSAAQPSPSTARLEQ